MIGNRWDFLERMLFPMAAIWGAIMEYWSIFLFFTLLVIFVWLEREFFE